MMSKCSQNSFKLPKKKRGTAKSVIKKGKFLLLIMHLGKVKNNNILTESNNQLQVFTTQLLLVIKEEDGLVALISL